VLSEDVGHVCNCFDESAGRFSQVRDGDDPTAWPRGIAASGERRTISRHGEDNEATAEILQFWTRGPTKAIRRGKTLHFVISHHIDAVKSGASLDGRQSRLGSLRYFRQTFGTTVDRKLRLEQLKKSVAASVSPSTLPLDSLGALTHSTSLRVILSLSNG
jgi:hypothetical protein